MNEAWGLTSDEYVTDVLGRVYKRFEPPVLMGSSSGWSARCRCEWGTGIQESMSEAIDAYTQHVEERHHYRPATDASGEERSDA